MKRINVIIMAFIMSFMSASLISAGGGKESSVTTKSNSVIVLNFPTYWVGTNLARPWWEAVYKRFNEKYSGKIELKIEELPSDTVYADKMKVLTSSHELPDVISGVNGVRDLAIQNGQATELTPYLNRDPDYRDKVIGPVAIAANTSSDGKIYSIVAESQVVGYFYNKEFFQKAGISPATTWDQWFSNCDKLKAIGVAPLALMTGENSWTTNLILSAMVASKGQAGQAFINTLHPKTYQTPEMIQSLTDIQRCLQNYTTPDALGAMYANAANNFFMEQAAIIANGPWMIADFSNSEKAAPGFEKKVAFAMYPGDGLVTSYDEGYVLCSPPERADAAWTLIQALTDRESQVDKLRLEGGLPVAADLKIPDDVRKNMPMVVDHADALDKMKYHGNTFDVLAYASVIDAFGRFYPELTAGTLTPAAMTVRLDEAAANAQ